jgi:hypothetical protein
MAYDEILKFAYTGHRRRCVFDGGTKTTLSGIFR